MGRIVQTLVGVVLIAAACAMGVAAVSAKGTVALEWPTATIILVFAIVGGFFVSKSLMHEALRDLTGVVRRVRPSAPTSTGKD